MVPRNNTRSFSLGWGIRTGTGYTEKAGQKWRLRFHVKTTLTGGKLSSAWCFADSSTLYVYIRPLCALPSHYIVFSTQLHQHTQRPSWVLIPREKLILCPLGDREKPKIEQIIANSWVSQVKMPAYVPTGCGNSSYKQHNRDQEYEQKRQENKAEIKQNDARRSERLF